MFECVLVGVFELVAVCVGVLVGVVSDCSEFTLTVTVVTVTDVGV